MKQYELLEYKWQTWIRLSQTFGLALHILVIGFQAKSLNPFLNTS